MTWDGDTLTVSDETGDPLLQLGIWSDVGLDGILAEVSGDEAAVVTVAGPWGAWIRHGAVGILADSGDVLLGAGPCSATS